MSDRAMRDIAVFVVFMVITGWIGVVLNWVTKPADPVLGIGVLVWLIGPPMTGLVMAFRAGGWIERLGLRPKLIQNGKWYLLAILITPAIVVVVMGVGILFGTISYVGLPAAGIGGVAFAFFASSAIKNVFEELCWRGFLTPWLEETRFAGLPNHLITGFIWSLWHVPYWLFFISAADIELFSGLPLAGFILVAFIILPLQAIFYGELRLATGSMWPPYVLHTVSNIVALTLLSDGMVEVTGPLSSVLSPGTGGVMYSVLLGIAGIAIYRWRVGSAQQLRRAV